MRIAIGQPAYGPWLGYFDLLDQVDEFVLLDSVQFERQSWQQRNRIKAPSGLQWLTVPVVFRGRLAQHISEVEIREPEFWRDHLRAIELNYRRASFFRAYFERFSNVIRSKAAHRNLSSLTIGLLNWFMRATRIKTRLLRSSEMAVEGKPTYLLARVCASGGASAYLPSPGSAEYLLGDLPVLTGRGLAVTFQHYGHLVYKQQFVPFQPYACVLGLLFNKGQNALEIIRSGRCEPFLPGDALLHVDQGVSS